MTDQRIELPALATPRLRLRPLDTTDAPFILRLLNEPTFLQFIGDRGVRTRADAERYVADGPQASYREHGLGLLLVERAIDGTPIGMCGLMWKPWLDAPDVAYAFVPEAAGHGYATEAARAVLDFARTQLHITRIVAVVLPDHAASIHVLEKLGFTARDRVTDPAHGAALVLYDNAQAP